MGLLAKYFKVSIEFQRIQTFLFAARRLRDMVGANVLLGETIRAKLVERIQDDQFATSRVNIEAICNEAQKPGEGPLVQNGETPLAHDPLMTASSIDEHHHPLDYDAPLPIYRLGVLSRDGGHFWALFTDPIAAEAFAREADKLIGTMLPGLRFSSTVEDLDDVFARNRQKNNQKRENQSLGKLDNDEQPEKDPRFAEETDIVHAPLFETCSESDLGYATPSPDGGKESIDDEVLLSRGLRIRRKAYRAFRKLDAERKGTRDIIGLLDLLGHDVTQDDGDDGEDKRRRKNENRDLHTLCGKDYLAVIVADGNDIGANANAPFQGENAPPFPTDISSFITREVRLEEFFRKTRVALRTAVDHAIKKVFAEARPGNPGRYKLMMLGGDDLLMVCPAKYASDFIIHFTAKLKELEAMGGPTVGIGVTITSPNVPFHNLHENAEALASSAKRLYRRLRNDGKPASTIDWMVETGSWTSDPIALRQQENLAWSDTDLLATSVRPLQVLSGQEVSGSAADSEARASKEPRLRPDRSFEQMVEAAAKLADEVGKSADDKAISRTKLLSFTNSLIRGRHASRERLSASQNTFKNALEIACGLTPETLWREAYTNTYTTPLKDIVELFEIRQLNTRRDQEGPS